MKCLGLVMVIFLAIALLAIALIFQPVKLLTEDSVYAPPATSWNGLELRAKAWKQYPEYNFGLGVIAGLGFAGAIVSGLIMLGTTEVKSEKNNDGS